MSTAPMQVVIPMSGVGARFLRAGYTQPKPLIDVDGRPIIAHLLDRFPRTWRFVFVCNEDHLRDTELETVLRSLVPEATIVSIAPHRLGPVHAVLQAADAVADDLPTVVNYCDFDFSWDPERFRRTMEALDCDGAVCCYTGPQPHYVTGTWYATCAHHRGRVTDIREKGGFGGDRTAEYASSGTYYFRDGALVKRLFAAQVAQGLTTNDEFYVSLAYLPLLAEGGDVRIYEIDGFCQWGTPGDLEDWQYWQRAFAAWARRGDGDATSHDSRLLMPMAGLGSRFSGLHDLPKPLIPVMGDPMFRAASQMLPASERAPVYIVQAPLEGSVRSAAPDATVVVLDAPTDGQAASTAHGEAALDPDQPVLVSSCDHGLAWNPQRWDALMAHRPDVVVVGQRGYPAASRTPHAYAYLEVEGDAITAVSVKQPISEQPSDDLVLVGTFWFRRASVLFDHIRALVAADQRVNGELYLDTVVNLCIEAGLDVRWMPSEAFFCWGTPEELQTFETWYHHFRGHTP